MGSYLIRRLSLTLIVLVGITLLTSVVMRLAPGGLTGGLTDLSARVSAHEQRTKFMTLYDLDKPWYVQYGRWLKRISRLDFGRSFKDDRPVLEKIGERLPNTLLLNFLSLGLVFLVAVPLGVLAAVKQNTFWDRAISVFVFIGFSVPTFWLALMLMILFGVKLGWLPLSGLHALNADEMSWMAYGADMAKHLILPVFISAFAGLAGLSRFVRNGLLEVIRQDYIRTARASMSGERLWSALRRIKAPSRKRNSGESPTLIHCRVLGVMSAPTIVVPMGGATLGMRLVMKPSVSFAVSTACLSFQATGPSCSWKARTKAFTPM